VFVMYDTFSGSHSRCKCYFSTALGVLTFSVCPHVSFVNPRASKDAAPRESIETRSIVITKI